MAFTEYSFLIFHYPVYSHITQLLILLFCLIASAFFGSQLDMQIDKKELML